jgi:uncharacterized damage-inducible protein DinB
MGIMTDVASPTRRAPLALAACLQQLATLLQTTPDSDYTWRHPSGVSGTVGAHVRHCLDHVHAVLDQAGGARLTYDHRQRATRTEQDRAHAVEQLHHAARQLLETDAEPDCPLTLDVQVDRDGASVAVPSSFGRELAFVLQHTIHHQALIALLLADRGARVPDTFGYAPSTPRPEDSRVLACAR